MMKRMPYPVCAFSLRDVFAGPKVQCRKYNFIKKTNDHTSAQYRKMKYRRFILPFTGTDVTAANAAKHNKIQSLES